MNDIGIVISRYYEDLKWIHEIKSNVDVYVYNRNGETPNMGVPNAVAWAKPKDDNDILGGLDLKICKDNGINLEVIEIVDDPGFEASTYAYHCYSKYSSLNNFTVFIQAHPEIYVRNIIGRLNNPESIKYTKYVESTGEQLTDAIGIPSETEIEFEPFCDKLGRLNPYDDYGWDPYKNNMNNIPWLEFCKHMPNSIIGENGNWKPANPWRFGAGNQFVVNKKNILKHDKQYYKRIQDFTNTHMDPNGDNRPSWQQLNQGPNIMEGIWQFSF